MKPSARTSRRFSLSKLWPALFTGHKPGVVNTLLAVLFLAIFITVNMAFFPWQSEAISGTRGMVINAPTPEVLPPTALPEDIARNREQTNGIVFGGVILVLIIVGGTFSVIGKKNPEH